MDRAGERGEFAARLRAERERAALSQEDLAERAGLTSKGISALERGERRRPYFHTVRALADALGLDGADRSRFMAAARPAPTSLVPEPTRSGPDRPTQTGIAARTTPIIGREAEIGDVVALLRSGRNRLVTITGPGGVGKTRLAYAVAHDLEDGSGEGTAIADCSLINDASLVLPTVARAFGLRPAGTADLAEHVAAHIAGSTRLLVLDNLEHLLPAAADIGELIAHCPGLVVLATSRAPLHIRAEQEFPLGPLALPASTDLPTVAASPAVRMFLGRAVAAAPRFALSTGTASAVAAICRRLDGLPLAIELAAAHARWLEPGMLLERLDEAVGTARSRDLPVRQATVRATLDWSHDLLTGEEQILLRRLSVFAGGGTLDAIEAVAGNDIDPFRALGGLVDQSLVDHAGDSSRYRLLEPVRQYAAGRLSAAGETTSVSARHAAYFCDLAEEAGHGLRGAGQIGWLTRLRAEHGNLRIGLVTLTDHGGCGSAAQLLGATWLFWALSGAAAEGLVWSERVLGDEEMASEDRGSALIALAGLRYATGDLAGTQAAGARAVECLADTGARGRRAEALVLEGSGAAMSGAFDAAHDRLADAVEISRSSGDDWALAHALTAQGLLRLNSHDVTGAAAVLSEAERIARNLGSPFTLATLLNSRASLHLLAGEDDMALDLLEEAARLNVEADTTWSLVYTLPALGVVAARRSLPDVAAVLFAAGRSTAAAASLAVAFPPDRKSAELYLAEVRAALDETVFTSAWAAGQRLRPADLPDLVARIRGRGAPL